MADAPSLRARVLRLLARREHSRAELKTRLAAAGGREEEVEALLDEFEKKGWLSETRLVEAVVLARRSRFGMAKVLQELRGKGVSESGLSQAREALAAGEFEAARAVWQRKFGLVPKTLQDKARQARFLAGRGFSADVVRRVLDWEEE